MELANKNEKVCLTVDCSNTNRDGPGIFRTEADNSDFQACYFNAANDEQVYNEFLSQRIKTSSDKNNFQFEIIELKSKTNTNITFDANEELHNLTRNAASANRRTKTIFGGGAKRRSPHESFAESNRRSTKRAIPGFLL